MSLVALIIIDCEPESQPQPSPASSCFTERARRDLSNDLAAAIPDKWRKVGIQLDLSVRQLDAVAMIERDPVNQFMTMLDWWERFDNTRRPCSWSTIVEVLRTNSVGEESLAKELEKKYCR